MAKFAVFTCLVTFTTAMIMFLEALVTKEVVPALGGWFFLALSSVLIAMWFTGERRGS